jgi:hypothetical protein
MAQNLLSFIWIWNNKFLMHCCILLDFSLWIVVWCTDPQTSSQVYKSENTYLKTCVKFFSVPFHSPDKRSSFFHALPNCIISASQDWNFIYRERERRPYEMCIETKIFLPFMIKVLFCMTCSSFVEMILCSLLAGNITVSYYCLSMCKLSWHHSYRITQSAYIPLNKPLQSPLLMLKLLGIFCPAEQILSDIQATECE